MLDSTFVHTTSLFDYLETYPFPAFAIPVPLGTAALPSHSPLSRHGQALALELPPAAAAQTSVTTALPPSHAAPLSPPLTPVTPTHLPSLLWSNAHWHRASRGQALRDCLTPDDEHALVAWLDHAIQRKHHNSSTTTQTPTRSTFEQPQVDHVDLTDDAFLSEDSRDVGIARSPALDLGTREGVRQWVANMSVPVAPYASPRERRRPNTLTVDFTFPHHHRPRKVDLVATVLEGDVSTHSVVVVSAVPVPRSRRHSSTACSCSRRQPKRKRWSLKGATASDETSQTEGTDNGPPEPMPHPKSPRTSKASFNDSASRRPSAVDMPISPKGGTRMTPVPSRVSQSSASVSALPPHVHPRLPSEFLTDANKTTTTIGGEYTPGRPIFIAGDGSIKAAPLGAVPAAAEDPMSVTHLLQTHDWSKTPLGPLSTWPESLKSITSMMSVFPLGTAVWWGKELTFLYNQAYSQFIANHPQLYGIHGDEGMRHLKSSLGALTPALLAGSSIYKDDEFYLRRDDSGQMRESYRSLLWAPIKNEKGHYGGIWHATRDTTPKVIADRRLALVRELSGRTSASRTIHDFERGVLDTLQGNPKDAPFAMMYFAEELASRTSDPREPRLVRLRFAGGVGVPNDHTSAPEVVTVPLPAAVPECDQQTPGVAGDSNPFERRGPLPPHTQTPDSPAASYASTFDSMIGSLDPGWQFADVLNSRQTMVVNCETLVQEYPSRHWDDLPSQAVVVPISLNSEEGLPSAVLVLGLSPMIPFDAQYEIFVDDLRFQMASYLTAVRSYDADQRRLGDLTTLDRAKSLLFSNVSHELLAPLTLISGPLDDVIVDMAQGPWKDSLVMAKRNVSRIARLVAMLVDISNLEAGRLMGSFAKVNLGVLTRDVAGMFAKAATKTSVTYSIACDERQRNVYVDRERWEKILFSLIENALKYTTAGFVKVTLEYTHKQAVLTVADSGVGISNAAIDELTRDFRPDGNPARTSTGTGGSGISLTFAKKLIQLHHGELEIESKTAHESGDGSHGTVFRVRIPLGSAHLPPDALATSSHMDPPDVSETTQFGREMIEEVSLWHTERERDDAESSCATISVSSGGDTKRSRGIDTSMLNFAKNDVIMIVEDMPEAQRYAKSIFERYCQVVIAKNGHDALAQYEQQPPDLIISDLILPGMNGTELLEALRNGTREQRLVPFIMLAAADDVRSNVMLTADDYLSKPFNARELVARANMQMQMGKERRTMEHLFDERTQELRLLSDHSPAGILRCDEQGNLIYANLAWRKMAGVSLNNAPIEAEHIDEESRDDVISDWKRFVDSDEAVTVTESKWQSGRWISFKMSRLDGSVLNGKGGFIGSAIDITERKLNEELQRLRIEEAEKRRAEAEEARSQQELLIDITSHEIRNPISSILQISLTPHRTHCASMVRNNLLALQEQLQHAVEELKETTAVETASAPTTPLQVVGPHTSAAGAFHPTPQLLLSLAEDLDALDSIYQCGLAQERISNDVLSLGKMQLDMLHMFDVETSIPAVARQVVSIFQNEARMNRITLDLAISDAFEQLEVDLVMTDPVRLSQIITNLLTNAIRFTSNSRERKIELKVDVSLQAPQKGNCGKPTREETPNSREPGTPVYIFMAVSDTGPGLTQSELKRLFQRFTQASPETHTVFGGSGLGLFVCRKLAERMGGQIEVTSEYGKGSQFRFFIKTTMTAGGSARKSCDKAGGKAKRAHSSPGKPYTGTPGIPRRPSLMPCSPTPTNTRKTRILVVEDNLINRTVLLRQLKHVGIAADSAINGLEAVNKIKTAMAPGSGPADRYDLVLMDIEMPVMDGYTAVRRVRSEEAGGGLRKSIIVALTGNARQAQIREGMADFDSAVIKPYRLDDLLKTIHGLIEAREVAENGGRRDTLEVPCQVRG